jgi:peroxiredoxin
MAVSVRLWETTEGAEDAVAVVAVVADASAAFAAFVGIDAAAETAGIGEHPTSPQCLL